MRSHIESSDNPHFETPLVPYKPTIPYNLRTYHLPKNFYTKPMEQSHLRQKVEAEKDKYRLSQLDKITLKQLAEDDRLLIESHLTPSERQYLLSRLETGEFDSIVFQDRFGLPSFDLIISAIEKIGAGAGSYIGGKLAGELGAKLGASAGAYLGIAAANTFTKKKDDPPKKADEDPSENGFLGKSFGLGGIYGAMLLKN
ncbi:unnamed protein product [Spodoptera littoralis]|uniref:Uncharacterized protein n=1 Tax=Spodoptera littoralis TaxID=7109 RepID=A0A9P0N3R4_SPOLI|nr:unnamed protein product [Spodoptera littoralis]CAH1638783.1 unnamed protein product [Spodoptera littoralis]